MAKTAKTKAIDFENSNLSLTGKGKDANGNPILKLKIGSNRGFSVQVSQTGLTSISSIIRGVPVSSLSKKDLASIEAKIVPFLQKFASISVKKSLKTY